jgi:hypothetical protein
MLPHAHLAVGYVLTSVLVRKLWDRPVARRELLPVLLGTQLPDLIDKPLALAVGGTFASGRTVGHSLLFAIPVIVVSGIVLRRRHGSAMLVVPFAVGYLSHPVLDGSVFLLQGTLTTDLVEVGFVLWPIGIPADGVVGFLAQSPPLNSLIEAKPRWTARHLPRGRHLAWYVRAVELGLASVATIRWVADDAPGLDAVRHR